MASRSGTVADPVGNPGSGASAVGAVQAVAGDAHVGTETGSSGATDGAPSVVPQVALPGGFRRLVDLRKRSPKISYEVLNDWVGKTIRLDGVSFVRETKDGKPFIPSGKMTFSEYNPADPDQEVEESATVTTDIPRGALKTIYEGSTLGGDGITIICDVVKTKKGIALQ